MGQTDPCFHSQNRRKGWGREREERITLLLEKRQNSSSSDPRGSGEDPSLVPLGLQPCDLVMWLAPLNNGSAPVRGVNVGVLWESEL